MVLEKLTARGEGHQTLFSGAWWLHAHSLLQRNGKTSMFNRMFAKPTEFRVIRTVECDILFENKKFKLAQIV